MEAIDASNFFNNIFWNIDVLGSPGGNSDSEAFFREFIVKAERIKDLRNVF